MRGAYSKVGAYYFLGLSGRGTYLNKYGSFLWKCKHDILDTPCAMLFKNSQFLHRIVAPWRFCHPAILQFWIADIFLNVRCKELKIRTLFKFNKLF